MENTVFALQPDSRGRVTLRTLIEPARMYNATRGDDGTIVLTPIVHFLSEEAYADLQADPHGFAEMLAAARAVKAGTVAGVSVDEFFASLKN